MTKPSPTLAALLAVLTTARTPEEIAAASAALFVAARPVLIPICTRMLQRLPATPYTGEDVAQDTLVTALPHLQRGACPVTTHDGVTRWLTTVATRRAITVIRPQIGVSTDELTAVFRALHAVNGTAQSGRVRAFAAAYDDVRAQLPAPLLLSWQAVVEQSLSVSATARTLGVARTTVLRRLRQSKAHFAARLGSFAP